MVYMLRSHVIENSPDDVKWMGMRVFPYTFRDGDSLLKATFEMASGGMTAVETNDYSIWCSIPTSDGEAPAGETIPITWHISPKTHEPIEMILLTEADAGLDIHVREHMSVTKPTDITRELRVLADAEPRHRGERERCVRSTLILNGVPIVLETGVEVVRPIIIDYAGQGLFPDREERIEVRLHSNLDREVTGSITMDSHPGLDGSGSSSEFTLPARQATQCSFKITGSAPGSCLTTLRYEAGGFRGTRPIAFRVLSSVTPVASIANSYDEEIIIESPGVKITHELRGGMLKIRNKSAGQSWQLPMPEPGPPFTSMRRSKQLFSGRLEQSGGEMSVVVCAEFPEYPGLILERRTSQMAGDLVRAEFRLTNTTALSMNLKLRLTLGRMGMKWLTLPLPGGIVREPTRDWDPYPTGGQDAMESIDSLSETWIASDSGSKVCGVIWHDRGQLEIDWRTGLTLNVGDICANSTVQIAPIYTVVGSGDWETVRGWWRKLVQPSEIREKYPPIAKRVLEVHTAQSPLLLTEDDTKAELIIENNRGRKLTAKAAVEAQGLTVEPSEFAIKEVNRQYTAHVPITITESSGYGAGSIRIEVKSESNSRVFKLPVIRLASPGIISVTQADDGRYTVQNGVLSYTVAPDFMGSITGLESGGVDYLHSSWPKAGSSVWSNPWCGGIHPYLDWLGDDQLSRERFTGAQVERTGESGLNWHGVRVECEPKHRSLRWLKIEAEYLTLPGSDLLALVYRWTNISTARLAIDGGIAIWAAVGGDRGKAVAFWESDGELRHRRRTMPGMDISGARWAAIENSDTGHRLEAIAGGRNAKVSIEDMSEEGAHLGVGARVSLDPEETLETICWLVVNPAASEFEAYAALSGVTKLP